MNKQGQVLHDTGFFNMESDLPRLSEHALLYLNCGYENMLKSKLFKKWSDWIVKDIATMRDNAQTECHEALKDPTSPKAKWELIEIEGQIVWAWAKRELMLLELAQQLEDNNLHPKMKLCTSIITGNGKDKQLESWMKSEYESGRRDRLLQDRYDTRHRLLTARNKSYELDHLVDPGPMRRSEFYPQWGTIIDFLDEEWQAGINYQWTKRVELEKKLETLIKKSEEEQAQFPERSDFLEQLKHQISYSNWRPQHKMEEELMKTAANNICNMPLNSQKEDLEKAYRYPDKSSKAMARFVFLPFSIPHAKVCSAIVYDVFDCNKEAVCSVIARSTTCSVVRVDPQILPFISPNNHLLFLSCFEGKGEEPAFINQNRNRWWEQQTANTSIFYYTPMLADSEDCMTTDKTTSAHIFVFLVTPCTIKINLLHCGLNAIDVTIQEKGKELARISGIPSEHEFQEFSPFLLQPGRHDLEVIPEIDGQCYYLLKHIHVELGK